MEAHKDAWPVVGALTPDDSEASRHAPAIRGLAN